MKPVIVLFFLFTSTPAFAQTDAPTEDAPQVQSHRVTSVESCINQLPPAMAAEVRQSLKPYEDCQKRLGQVLEKKAEQEEKLETAKNAVPEAETPRNYVRVQSPAETAAPTKKP